MTRGIYLQSPFGAKFVPEDVLNRQAAAVARNKREAPTLPEIAYMALLSIPVDSILRTRAQAAMCAVRDLIAQERGCEAEDVQNEFEAAIATIDAFPLKDQP